MKQIIQFHHPVTFEHTTLPNNQEDGIRAVDLCNCKKA